MRFRFASLEKAIRPQFGPTLPALLRSSPPIVRWLLLALAALPVIAAIVWALLASGSPLTRIVVTEPIAFNFGYDRPLARQRPPRGALARVGDDRRSLTVRPLKLPPYSGDSAGFFPVYAVALARKMERERPGLVWRYDGRVSINQAHGYEIGYVIRERGQRIYGRRVMLLPDVEARDGVELTLEAPADKAISNPMAIGGNGPLRTAMRSFRFGTSWP